MPLRILDTTTLTRGKLHIVAIGNKTYIHVELEQDYAVFKEADVVTTKRVHDALVAAIQNGAAGKAEGGEGNRTDTTTELRGRLTTET